MVLAVKFGWNRWQTVPQLFAILFFMLAITVCDAAGPSMSRAADNDGSSTLTLPEGLRIVTDNNYVIKIASRNEDISYNDVLIAKSKFLPSVNALINQTFQAYQPGVVFQSLNVYESDKNFLSYGVNVQQTIYDFGAISSLYDASKTALDATRLDIRRTKNLVALDFINSYVDLLETEKIIIVSMKEVESLQSHLKLAQALYQEGAITKNDLLQADVKLSDGRQRLVIAKNRRALSASRLNTILTRPIKEEVRVADLSNDLPPMISLESAWQNAETQRLELQIIDHQLTINDLEETAKKSEYYPTIFAQAGYNYTENHYITHEDNWTLLLGLNVNLFSGGSTKAEVTKARYRREQLIEQRKKIADDIKFEVEKYYRDMEDARERILTTQDAISQAEENLRIDKTRYQEGVGTATELLDAITLLSTAQTNYYRALYDFWRAHAGLLYAMGLDLSSQYL